MQLYVITLTGLLILANALNPEHEVKKQFLHFLPSQRKSLARRKLPLIPVLIACIYKQIHEMLLDLFHMHHPKTVHSCSVWASPQ